MKPIKRSHKLLIALVLSAIIGVCALLLLARSSYPRIETIAVQIPIPTRVTWYDWISDTEALLCDEHGPTRRDMQKLNVVSGICLPEKTINDAFAKLDVREIESLSPNRKWISGFGLQSRGRELAVDFVSLEGATSVVSSEDAWPPGKLEGAWSPDSKRWIFQTLSSPGFILTEFFRDGEQKTPDHTLPETIENPHVLGFAHNGALIVGDFEWEFNTPAAQEVRICQYPYGTTQKMREGKIVFPCLGKIWNVALDPRGERLLWQLRVDLKDSRPQWLRDTMNLLHMPSKNDAINLFWVCNVDGSNGKIVGILDISKSEDADSISSRCRWLPSGIKFSFVSGKTLWVVPVSK